MRDRNLRDFERAPDYRVTSIEGFNAVAMMRAGPDGRPVDANYQLNFWNVDSRPVSENLASEPMDKDRIHVETRPVLVSAVQLRPDTTLLLGLTLIRSVVDLPPEVRARYGIPDSVDDCIAKIAS
jgi:hypothetical protein